jgi:hypothetical protein
MKGSGSFQTHLMLRKMPTFVDVMLVVPRHVLFLIETCAMPKRGQFVQGRLMMRHVVGCTIRQFGNKSASVALLSSKCRRRSNGEIFAQSGSIPGSKDLGPMLEPSGRWSGLQSTASV